MRWLMVTCFFPALAACEDFGAQGREGKAVIRSDLEDSTKSPSGHPEVSPGQRGTPQPQTPVAAPPAAAATGATGATR